jgi:hypothetical protein
MKDKLTHFIPQIRCPKKQEEFGMKYAKKK